MRLVGPGGGVTCSRNSQLPLQGSNRYEFECINEEKNLPRYAMIELSISEDFAKKAEQMRLQPNNPKKFSLFYKNKGFFQITAKQLIQTKFLITFGKLTGFFCNFLEPPAPPPLKNNNLHR